MRRPDSSSCLLLPKKESSDAYDETLSDSAADVLSVTVFHREEMPSYSCERFYLLSELELLAYSTIFLSEMDLSSSATADQDTDDEDDEATNRHADLAPYAILYLLWRPTVTCSAEEYAEQFILPAVQKILQKQQEISSERAGNQVAGDTNPESNQKAGGRMNLYLVVDRLISDPSKDDNKDTQEDTVKQQHEQHEKCIEELAQYVAKHDELRRLVQGITVGITNHERAAPGLEICVDAVTLGTRERRRQSQRQQRSSARSSERSFLGMVSVQPEDLVGLDPQEVTDAVQGMWQLRVSTEWNGHGNLKSFAERAQAHWRDVHGVPAVETPKDASGLQRVFAKGGRRGNNQEDAEVQRVYEEQFRNSIAVLLISVYLWLHFRHEVDFWSLFCYYINPIHWIDELIERLRSM